MSKWDEAANALAGVTARQIRVTPSQTLPPSQAETTTVTCRVLNAEARRLRTWVKKFKTSNNAVLGILVRMFLNDTLLQKQVLAELTAASKQARVDKIKAWLEDEEIRAQVLEEMTEE